MFVGRGIGRLQLEQEPVRLDTALVVRLVVEGTRQRVDDLASELRAARLDEELVHVLGGVLLVLDEHRDEVLERLALQLVDLRFSLVAGLGPLLGRRLEDGQEAPCGFIRTAEPPQTPRALEQRDVVQLAVLVLQDLLVLLVRGLVVREVLGELVLGAEHVRVRHESALREPGEDLVEAIHRLLALALLVREKAIDVEREVVVAVRLVVLENAQEPRASPGVVGIRRRPALVARRLVPLVELQQEIVARRLPFELADAQQRFRHLGRTRRCLGDELREQPVRLCAQLLLLGDIAADARIDLLFEQRAQPLGDLQVDAVGALVAGALLGPLLDGRALALSDGALADRLDFALLARHRWRGVVGPRNAHDTERQERRQQSCTGLHARSHLRPSPPTYSSFQSSPS